MLKNNSMFADTPIALKIVRQIHWMLKILKPRLSNIYMYLYVRVAISPPVDEFPELQMGLVFFRLE